MQGKFLKPDDVYPDGSQGTRSENQKRRKFGQKKITDRDTKGEKMNSFSFELVVK